MKSEVRDRQCTPLEVRGSVVFFFKRMVYSVRIHPSRRTDLKLFGSFLGGKRTRLHHREQNESTTFVRTPLLKNKMWNGNFRCDILARSEFPSKLRIHTRRSVFCAAADPARRNLCQGMEEKSPLEFTATGRLHKHFRSDRSESI